LTGDEVLALYEGQGWKCGICRAVVTEGGRAADSGCVDHDHATGKVRGILCMNCNRGLGMLKDSTENLRRAIAYLGRRST
jgi:hypothetical protein